MLSRKLLGGVAVGILSVALVPVTWAHTHQTSKSSTPARLAVEQSSPKKTASSTGAKTMSSHHVTTHKLASHHNLHSKTSHTKLASHTKPVSHSSKLSTSKKPASKNLVSTKKIAK